MEQLFIDGFRIPRYWEYSKDWCEKNILNDIEINENPELEMLRDYCIDIFIQETGFDIYDTTFKILLAYDFFEKSRESLDCDELNELKDYIKYQGTDWDFWDFQLREIDNCNYRMANKAVVGSIEHIKSLVKIGKLKRNELIKSLHDEISRKEILKREEVKSLNLSNGPNFFDHIENQENIENGFIYVLSNPLLENKFKIGFTVRNPDFRADELSKNSSTLAPFVIERFWRVKRPREKLEVIKEKIKNINLEDGFCKAQYSEILKILEETLNSKV